MGFERFGIAKSEGRSLPQRILEWQCQPATSICYYTEGRKFSSLDYIVKYESVW
jgi:hypothetical protein